MRGSCVNAVHMVHVVAGADKVNGGRRAHNALARPTCIAVSDDVPQPLRLTLSVSLIIGRGCHTGCGDHYNERAVRSLVRRCISCARACPRSARLCRVAAPHERAYGTLVVLFPTT